VVVQTGLAQETQPSLFLDKLAGSLVGWAQTTCPPCQTIFKENFVKKEYLAVVLLLSGLLVGFFVGREFPRETLLEKECRIFTEKYILEHPGADYLFGAIIGRCISGTL
jgi:hypothetical protein